MRNFCFLLIGAGIGDCILHIPLFHRLHKRVLGCRIWIVINTGNPMGQILLHCGFVDEVIETRIGLWDIAKLALDLRKLKCDACVLTYLQRTSKLAWPIWVLVTKSIWIAGYQHASPFVRRMLKPRIVEFDKSTPIYTSNLALADMLSCSKEESGFSERGEVLDIIQETFPTMQIGKTARRVVFHIGTNQRKVIKTLEFAKWRPLIEYLISKQAEVIFLGGSEESEGVTRFLETLGQPAVNLVGKLDLPEVFKEIANCDLFVGNDGGLMHIAGLFNKQIIAFFGATNPIRYGPLASDALTFSPAVKCRHCSEMPGDLRCRRASATCRETDLPSNVWEKARRVVEAR